MFLSVDKTPSDPNASSRFLTPVCSTHEPLKNSHVSYPIHLHPTQNILPSTSNILPNIPRRPWDSPLSLFLTPARSIYTTPLAYLIHFSAPYRDSYQRRCHLPTINSTPHHMHPSPDQALPPLQCPPSNTLPYFDCPQLATPLLFVFNHATIEKPW